MARNYIIHLPHIGEETVHWALSNDAGELVSDIRTGALSEAASEVEGRRSIVVLPGNDVLLAEVNIPGGSASRAQQAAPYVLEELVADDVESLHFALGSKNGADTYPVAVINRDVMESLQVQMENAGLRPTELVPETLALPKIKPDAGGPVWTMLSEPDRSVVRLNGYRGFAADNQTAELMLHGARAELGESETGSLVLYRAPLAEASAMDAPVTPTNDSSITPLVPDFEIETHTIASRLELFARGLASSPRINLLQGAFSHRQQFDQAWKPWRWSAVLLAVLLGVFGAGWWIEYRALGQQLDTLNGEIDTIHRKYFPNSNSNRPRAVMSARLRQLGSAQNNTGYVVSLQQVVAAIDALPGADVRSINYNKGRFDLDLLVPDLPSIDRLKQSVESAGTLTLKVQSTTRKDQGVNARLRVESK